MKFEHFEFLFKWFFISFFTVIFGIFWYFLCVYEIDCPEWARKMSMLVVILFTTFKLNKVWEDGK